MLPCLRILIQIQGVRSLWQLLACRADNPCVCGSIEMQCIHDIANAVDRTFCNKIDVLIPMWAAHQYNVVWIIFPDFGYDGLGVDLQVFPFVLYRFVVELIEYIWILAVFLCILLKKVLASSVCILCACQSMITYVPFLIAASTTCVIHFMAKSGFSR